MELSLLSTQHSYRIFADYFQFYLMDDEVQPLIPDTITEEDMRRHVKVAPPILVVYTARNTTVPLTIEVHDNEQPVDMEEWDHVTECSLAVPSGRIVIAGCTDYLPDCPRLQVSPGLYQARVCFGRLGDVGEDGLEGNDYYRIVLWQASAKDVG